MSEETGKSTKMSPHDCVHQGRDAYPWLSQCGEPLFQGVKHAHPAAVPPHHPPLLCMSRRVCARRGRWQVPDQHNCWHSNITGQFCTKISSPLWRAIINQCLNFSKGCKIWD